MEHPQPLDLVGDHRLGFAEVDLGFGTGQMFLHDHHLLFFQPDLDFQPGHQSCGVLRGGGAGLAIAARTVRRCT